MGGFRFLEHLADAYIEAYGGSYEECYGNAGLALFEVITDISLVEPREERIVEAEGEDLEALLYDWLEKLLIMVDVDGFLASKIDVEYIRREGDTYRLRAHISGETYDPGRHVSKTSVKAVTYHQMKVYKDEEGIKTRFILDL
ncbi:MAG: archease [Candidatus Bathyarchaeia archaeon]